VPQQLLTRSQNINLGDPVIINNTATGTSTTINAATLAYLTGLSDRQAAYSSATTVTVNALAAINPVSNTTANKNEFDVYINGQYIDKAAYTWTPSDILTQTIVFDTGVLAYTLDAQDVVIVNGRWA
jgi:hypothetical protein